MLTQLLQAEGRLLSDRLASAFARVDRRAFLAPEPTSPHQFAYKDTPLPIGYGQTISAPHMHATCLDLLEDKLQPGARVLDVGSGSGFLSAVMGLLVLPGGHVTGVEKVTDLAQRSVQSIQASQPDLLRDGTVNILAGNALSDILAGEEEYDAIHVGAAAASMPNNLLAKLAKGGRMVRA